jgi:hypothetical protein
LAAAKLEKFYEIKKATPELFTRRDPHSEEIQHSLDCVYSVVFPRTLHNCTLISHKLRNFNAKEYDFEVATKTYIMKVEENLYQNGPTNGIIFINDSKDVSLSHLFRVSLSSIRKSLRFLQEGIPINIEAVHILNSVPFMGTIMSIVKPLMRSDLLNKMHFHSSNMDFEKFYEQHIPKTHLPKDYGGDLEPIEELHSKQRETLMEMRDYFLMEEEQMNLISE